MVNIFDKGEFEQFMGGDVQELVELLEGKFLIKKMGFGNTRR